MRTEFWIQNYWRPGLIGILLITITHLLIACIPGGTNFSPASAASQELIQNKEAIRDTIRIHQTQSWRKSRMLLASYERNKNNEQMSCEAVFQMHPSASGWQISETGSSCSIPPNTDAVTFGSGTLGVAPDDFSYVFGLVRLETAKMVEITWQDGVIQRVPVVNGSYLTLRDGNIQMSTRVEVLDATDKVIHEIETVLDIENLQ